MSPIVNVARALTARLRDAEEYVSREEQEQYRAIARAAIARLS